MILHLIPQMFDRRRQIDRCGSDVIMTHHSGQAENIAATLNHQRRKRMAQLMDVKPNTARLAKLSNQLFQSAHRKRPVHREGCEERWTLLVQTPTFFEINEERARKLQRDRDDPVLRVFPLPNRDFEIFEIHIRKTEIEQFRAPQPGQHQRLKHGIVASTHEWVRVRVIVDDLQQRKRLLLG